VGNRPEYRDGVPLVWDNEWNARFDQYVLFTEDHWFWIGYVDPEDGYGRFKAAGAPRRTHRLAYARWVGPLVDDDEERIIVDHVCRIRNCIRPEHLKLVTYAENAANADNPIAENMHKTECDRGHPFDAANTYPIPGGGRACRTCRREWMREYRARKRAQGTTPREPATTLQA
jgi:hypothetical protein